MRVLTPDVQNFPSAQALCASSCLGYTKDGTYLFSIIGTTAQASLPSLFRIYGS